VEGLCVCSNYDATPITVAFGAMAPELAEYARYPILAEDGRTWKLVGLEAFLDAKGFLVNPANGITVAGRAPPPRGAPY